MFARAREKARQASCLSNVKQISLGFLMYTQDYDESMPCALIDNYGSPGHVWGNSRYWWETTEPYVKNWQIYRCPSDPSPWYSGGGGAITPDGDISDGGRGLGGRCRRCAETGERRGVQGIRRNELAEVLEQQHTDVVDGPPVGERDAGGLQAVTLGARGEADRREPVFTIVSENETSPEAKTYVTEEQKATPTMPC